MKPIKKELESIEFIRLEQGFGDWLSTLGYSQSTVYGAPRQLREFFCWMEAQDCKSIDQLTAKQIESFIEYFKTRPNQRQSGGLSTAHINKQLSSLRQFSKYLKSTKQGTFSIQLKNIKSNEITKKEILSKEEIQELYAATMDDLIGVRDRVMLGVYYGCGLRKSEGLALEISDILFERRLLYVRNTKNRHERYVPISLKVLQDLEEYIYHTRPLLLDETHQTESLFLSERGKELQGQTLVLSLRRLKEKTTNSDLQSRSFGFHALRHSIATHLLQAGMDLENIALFLGHKSLDSTQIYTHLAQEL